MAPATPPTLSLHSMWATGPASLLEILGIMPESDSICVRVWVPIEGLTQAGWFKIAADCPSRGAGTTVTVRYSDLFSADTAVRVITHPD